MEAVGRSMRLQTSLRGEQCAGIAMHRVQQMLARLCAMRHDSCNDHSPWQEENALYTAQLRSSNPHVPGTKAAL